MTTTRDAATAAEARAQGYPAPASKPTQRRSGVEDDAPAAVRISLAPSSVRATDEEANTARIGGFACVTETPYEMYDFFGPYTEIVSLSAFDKTLAEEPLVEYALNHGRGGGASMAHTRNETLELTVVKDGEPTGLEYDATVDTRRGDVRDMVLAIGRGDLVEASFKFRIVRGQWSPDYMEFRIEEVDLDRGDVSSVNFGANPNASTGLRAEQVPEVDVPVRQRPDQVVPDEDVRHRTIVDL